MPQPAPLPNGNIEIHATGEREVIFVLGVHWKVDSGYAFEFTRQGNLEVRNPSGTLLWESGTRNGGANKLSLRANGELAIFAVGRAAPLWSSKTFGNKGAFVAFQMDGNMVIYSAERQPLWATDTNDK